MTSTTEIPLTPVVTAEPASGAQEPAPRLTRLGPLEAAQKLKVKQRVRLNDICGLYFGCEAKKKYIIQGSEGDTLYQAKEDSECCGRCLFANIRTLQLSVKDQTGNEILSLDRPLNCSGWCCWFCYPKCTQRLTVSMGGQPVGFIRERATWCFPVYHIFDSREIPVMKIRGPFCHFLTCKDVEFDVINLADSAQLATITKKWLGCCRETVIDADNFEINFQNSCTVEEKALILAATFLIDLMYYENDGL